MPYTRAVTKQLISIGYPWATDSKSDTEDMIVEELVTSEPDSDQPQPVFTCRLQNKTYYRMLQNACHKIHGNIDRSINGGILRHHKIYGIIGRSHNSHGTFSFCNINSTGFPVAFNWRGPKLI